MPNLKPTSVKSADCPACGAGHLADGHSDDGNVDASSAACRTCIWSKRVKPQLYDEGVTTFWLDDDERIKFRFNAAKCSATAPIGAACSSSACCASGFCDPSVEKCAKKQKSSAAVDERGRAAARPAAIPRLGLCSAHS